jgi:predicted HNH restriction endonuclease
VTEHHVISGKGRRKVCDKYHMVIPLCMKCHEEVHHNRDLYLTFAEMGQKWYEANVGTREDFRKDFGKSWM